MIYEPRTDRSDDYERFLTVPGIAEDPTIPAPVKKETR
jgi:hypothetical protein